MNLTVGRYVRRVNSCLTLASQRISRTSVCWLGALDPAMKFYGDILGFEEFWRGGSSSDVLSWVNMRVPDGKDYLEFMLYSAPHDATQIGVKNHICLITPDIKAAVAMLESRPSRKSYPRAIEIKTVRTENGRLTYSILMGLELN